MPNFSTERAVSFTPKQMFDLVADIENYPQFVPLCQSLILQKSETAADGRKLLIADMTVAYKLIRESFVSKVVLDENEMHINSQYLSGPFSHLDSNWRFQRLNEGSCLITFDIDYAFKSKILSGIMGQVFGAAFARFADAFEERAKEIYGQTRADWT